MKYLLPFLLAALAACQNVPQSPNSPSVPSSPGSPTAEMADPDPDEETANPIIWGGPEMTNHPDYLIFPLILGRDVAGRSSGLIDYYKSEGSYTYWNLVFYNTKTQASHLLDPDKKMIIHSYQQTDNEGPNTVVSRFIFYYVTSTDYDVNGSFDAKDPKYLYVSDKAGNNFRQISPDGFSARSWKVIDGTDNIRIDLIRDSNGDHRFEESDETVFYLCDMKSGEPAKPFFSNDFQTLIKESYHRHWPSQE